MAENNEFVRSDYIRYIDIDLQDIALKRKVNNSYLSIYILINFRRSKNKENTCDLNTSTTRKDLLLYVIE